MTDQHAYSTSDPAIVAVYQQAVKERAAMVQKIKADVEALGADSQVFLRSAAFPGSKDTLTTLQPKGDHIPEGWRIVRGKLEPRRGKAGDAARQWLSEHQPVDVRHVLEPLGLPRCSWIPRGDDFGYRLVPPKLFEHDGTLWAAYEGEPGTADNGFDTAKCTWTPRKLSEFYAALEAYQAAQAPAEQATEVPA